MFDWPTYRRGPQAGLFCCDSIYFTAFRWSAPARGPAFHIRATSTVAMVSNAAAIAAIRKRTLQRTECTKKQFCLPIGLSGTAETEGGNVCWMENGLRASFFLLLQLNYILKICMDAETSRCATVLMRIFYITCNIALSLHGSALI